MPDPADSEILSAILDAAVDAMVVADAKGTILRANRATHDLFGHDPDALIGANVRVLMPEDHARAHDEYMTAYRDTGIARIVGIGRDLTGRRADASTFPLHLSVGEAKVGAEPVFVAILHDLSQRRAGETALARSMRLDAVGQMTGGITHDFNNLLTVIIGNLELAEATTDAPDTRRYLARAMEAAETGAGLTSRLMIFARKGSLKPEAVDLGNICRKTVALLERTLGEAYEIAAQCPEGLPRVHVDPVQLESAIVNIAVNARDAMPEGGRILFQVSEIEIDDTYMAQETHVAPGHYLRLLVSDNGSGMSEEAQARAFEPFFTTKAPGQGTGLGLAMVHGFVRQSGGHITLYSELGHGTAIGVYLPALPRDADEAGSGPNEAGPDALPRGNGERILVVEDSAHVRQITADRLLALGYAVEVAESGDAAWRMLEGGLDVAVVLSDVIMPGALNGFDLARRIDERFPSIGVILTSGYASDAVSDRLPGAPDADLLHKPYHQGVLARRLSELLRRSSD
ncbi:Blue-light-activated protein [Roseivivax sp. THAF40]|uniref:PAS domain S-box protein n=1 Tax=unclassified Roseivivax TaxID=2639302 RepID=UPI0012A795B8|nr:MULTISPECIES: PAS domain S-box protein [unclassified Roseivivax]QFS83541.1 Blue-light-activated protein [Roseivivax sp. THAF197b]QFT47286.1 Blue-light-activated protein [Roseivivax sp. THAF40]